MHILIIAFLTTFALGVRADACNDFRAALATENVAARALEEQFPGLSLPETGSKLAEFSALLEAHMRAGEAKDKTVRAVLETIQELDTVAALDAIRVAENSTSDAIMAVGVWSLSPEIFFDPGEHFVNLTGKLYEALGAVRDAYIEALLEACR